MSGRGSERGRRVLKKRLGVVAAALTLVGGGAAAAVALASHDNTSGPGSPPPAGTLAGGSYTTLQSSVGPVRVQSSVADQLDLATAKEVSASEPYVVFAASDPTGSQRCMLVQSTVNPDSASYGCATPADIATAPRFLTAVSGGEGFVSAMVQDGATVEIGGAPVANSAGIVMAKWSGANTVITQRTATGGSSATVPGVPKTP